MIWRRPSAGPRLPVMWKPFVLALALFGLPGAAEAKPPVWIVRDADSELVLFGSIHVLPPGLDWTPPALTEALRSADDLWFELPIDPVSEAETARLAMQTGLLPAGETLSSLLPAADAARMARMAERYGVALPMIDRLQPWYAEVALAQSIYLRAGGTMESGVEKSVAALASPDLARRAFETPAEQVALFNGAPRTAQIASLRQTLKEMETDPDQFRALIAAWMAGDLKAIDKEAIQPLREASPTIYKRFLTDRNARWTPMLRQRLAGSGRTVVVVGVGHLIGPGGLPARLRALGYSVEGP